MSEDFYSLVQRRIWNDAGFRKLSKPPPNARDLFLYLLTTPHATQVPGLLAMGEAAMAEDLGWPVAGLRKCLAEVEAAGMLKVDRAERLLWLPHGLRHNPPRSPDNVKGWAKHWRMLPECSLLREAAVTMMAAFCERGQKYSEAFSRISGLPMPYPMVGPIVTPKQAPTHLPTPAPQIQDQEQIQEQEQKEEQTPLPPQAGSVGSVEVLPEPRPDAGPPSPGSVPLDLPTPETPSAPRRGRRKGAQAMLPGFVAEPADDVFAAYVDAWKRKVGGGAVPLLSEDRRKLVRARLAEGHVLATLKDAAAGIFLSEWHYMNRKDGRCSFDLALRDTENVEKFAGLSEAAKPKPKRPEWLDEGTQMSPRMKAAWKEQLRTGIKPDTSGFSLETFLEGNGVDHMLEGLE